MLLTAFGKKACPGLVALVKTRCMNKSLTTLLLAWMTLASWDAKAQEITLTVHHAPLDSIFAKIEQQTSFRFVFTREDLAGSHPVTLSCKQAAIETVLPICFKDQPVSYRREDQFILVQKREIRGPDSLPPTERGMITGRVVNEKGEPVVGATIKIKGTERQTITSETGVFTLPQVDNNAILVVTSVQYETQDIGVGKKRDWIITLKQKVNALDETVVIGYGTTTQRYSTGDVGKITSTEIEEQPVENPLSALQGRIPGVLVTSGVGLPGSNVTVQIRGINSIASGNTPLYIVDGVPFSGTPLNNPGTVLQYFNTAANGALSPFNSISPSDIERIDVLKDADATAIYGSRGANGVILITTKKGKAGESKFEMNIYTGAEEATHIVKTVNTAQYLELTQEALTNDGQIPTIANAPQLVEWNPTKYTNFQQAILGNVADVTEANASVSGGTAGTRFLLGGNYRKEGTIYPGSMSYSRGGGHLNVEHNASNGKFYASITTSYTVDDNHSIAQSISNFTYVPNFPLFDSTGNFNWTSGNNYLANLLQTNHSTTDNFIANALLRISILPGLNLKTSLGFDKISLTETTIFPLASSNPAYNPINSAQYGTNASSASIIEPQLDYARLLGKSAVQALLGGTYQYNTSQGNAITGQNYSNENLLQSLGAAGSISNFPPPATSYTQYKYVSLFGRFTYTLDKAYILNITGRRDGSSRFGPGKQYGNFGSIGTAWIFTEQAGIKKGLPFLSFGKWRASYGTVGNDQISDYQYLATYSSSSIYEGVSALQPAQIANPNYSWEINKKLETGLELGFLKDRILLVASWFRNISTNQLVGYPLPSQTGFTSYQYNLPAKVRNEGSEFSITSINISGKTFNWKTSFNLSFINNRLLAFPGLASSSYASTYVVGKSLSIQKGFSFSGIDPQTGLPQFRTANGQTSISPVYPTDQVAMGQTIPPLYGGLTNTIGYRNIELSFLLQFVKQQGLYPYFWPGSGSYAGEYMPPETLNRWQQPGDKTTVPLSSTILYNTPSAAAYDTWITSSRFWGNTSYLRLKNVSISYSLPKSWLAKLKINQAKLYVLGQNLFTLTRYPGSDPELPSGLLITPTLRIITAGLKLTI
jgi:TonB-linked SusC/RagA family outer membrane protein